MGIKYLLMGDQIKNQTLNAIFQNSYPERKKTMGDKGTSRQKSRKENKKKAKNTILEKRKIKKEKKKKK